MCACLLMTAVRPYLRLSWTVVGLALFAACFAVGATVAEPKRVLLLHSFGHDFAPYSDFAATFRTELARRSGQPVDVYDVSLLSARSSTPHEDAPFVDHLLALFPNRQPDLVVTIGAPALRFAQRQRQRLFPQVPMLLAAAEQRHVRDASLTADDTVVATMNDLPGLIENILQVLPETTTVAVVLGASPLEKFWAGELRRELEPFANRINFLWFDQHSLEEIKQLAAALPPRSAILYGIMLVDAAGVSHTLEQALKDLHAAANAPIFGIYNEQLDQGIVGGRLISTRELGRNAVDVAVRIFRGETPSAIRTAPLRPGTPVYNWRELQRWGISEASLPAGSTVQFREPTVWQLYRWHIVTALLVLLLQAAFIVALLIERRRRNFAELESRKRLGEVAHLSRSVALGEISASLAHELNQPLGAILNNAGAAEMLIKSGAPVSQQLNEILADIKRDDQRASDVIARLRAMLRKSEFAIRDVDLNAAVEDVARFVAAEASVRSVALRVELEPALPAVRGDRVQLQQVILNLALNGMDAMGGQAAASREMVICTGRMNGSEALISVVDSGVGIPEEKLTRIFEPFTTTKPQGMGLGLSISRTIVEAHGGRIWAERAASRGAVLRFTVPLATAG